PIDSAILSLHDALPISRLSACLTCSTRLATRSVDQLHAVPAVTTRSPVGLLGSTGTGHAVSRDSERWLAACSVPVSACAPTDDGAVATHADLAVRLKAPKSMESGFRLGASVPMPDPADHAP